MKFACQFCGAKHGSQLARAYCEISHQSKKKETTAERKARMSKEFEAFRNKLTRN